jgi:hypothetical protein
MARDQRSTLAFRLSAGLTLEQGQLAKGSSTGDLVALVSSQRAADAQPRFCLRDGGQHEWGGGTAGADVILARTAPGVIELTKGELRGPSPFLLMGA